MWTKNVYFIGVLLSTKDIKAVLRKKQLLFLSILGSFWVIFKVHHHKKYLKKKIACAGNWTCTQTPSDSKSIALTTRPWGKLCQLFKASLFFLAGYAFLFAEWDNGVSESVSEWQSSFNYYILLFIVSSEGLGLHIMLHPSGFEPGTSRMPGKHRTIRLLDKIQKKKAQCILSTYTSSR